MHVSFRSTSSLPSLDTNVKTMVPTMEKEVDMVRTEDTRIARITTVAVEEEAASEGPA